MLAAEPSGINQAQALFGARLHALRASQGEPSEVEPLVLAMARKQAALGRLGKAASKEPPELDAARSLMSGWSLKAYGEPY